MAFQKNIHSHRMQNGDKEAGLLCNWLPRDIFLQVKPRRTTKIYSIWGEHTGIMLHVNWQASYHKFMLSLMTKYVQHSVSFWSFFGTSVFFFFFQSLDQSEVQQIPLKVMWTILGDITFVDI